MKTGNPLQPDEHISIRITALDTTRATEQTAILMALVLGRFEKKKGPRPDQPKEFAWSSLLGYLHRIALGNNRLAYNHADVLSDVHFIDDPVGSSTQHFHSFCTRVQDARMNVHNELLDNFDMEFVVSPVDGAAACYRGLAGALSVLAGGRPGSFRQPPNDWYLVIATAPGLVNEPEWNQKLRTALGHNTIDVSSAMDIFLTELFRTQVLAHNQPSFSTSTLLSFRKHDPLAAVCSKYSRMRVSTGSPIAHALAVYSFNPTFDMFAAVVKSGQASLIAAAARSTGGGFFAFPVTVQKKKADDVVAFVSDFVGDDHFVREDADVFLNATAISHCAVLEGVRFDERENNVVTQTLSLRSHTRSQRRLINLHNHAREKVFHLLDTTTLARLTKTYDEILAEVNELIK